MSYSTDPSNVPTKLYVGGYTTQVDNIKTVLFDSNGPSLQGIVLLTPADGAINVSVTPSFTWDSETEYDGYKILIADNAEYTNAREAYVSAKNYNEVTALLNNTNYFWKVEGGTITDRTAIVPDSGFTGMTVWDATTDPAPIYIPNDIYPQSGSTPDGVAPLVRESAEDLADYIEQSSGKTRPTVIGVPSNFNFPQRCIKVGFPNPALTEREQIQIKCVDGGPIELTGVDEFDRNNTTWGGQEDELNFMVKAGTYHAVMTFLQEHMGIVWAFYGPLGEVVPTKTSLSINAMDYLHSPSAIHRNYFGFSSQGQRSPYGVSKDWLKKQRNFYCYKANGGHAFRGWYDYFHPLGDPGGDKPYLFALQPNETRDDPPEGRGAKLEVGDPRTVQEWFDTNVQGILQGDGQGGQSVPESVVYYNPLEKIFACHFGDASTTGHSIDARSREMDYPQQGRVGSVTQNSVTAENQIFAVDEHVGKTVAIYTERDSNAVLFSDILEVMTVQSNTNDTLVFTENFQATIDANTFFVIIENDVETWGSNNDQFMITDRELLFTKRCLAKLQENYSNEDFFVSMLAYGPARPAPKREDFDENIIVVNVVNDFNNPNESSGINNSTARQNFEDWLAWGGNQIWRPNVGDGYGHTRGFWMSKHIEVGNRLKDILGRGCVGFRVDQFWEHWASQWPMYYVVSQLLWDHTKDVDAILDKAYDALFGDAAVHIKAYYDKVESVVTSIYSHGANFKLLDNLWSFTLQSGNVLETHIENAKLVLDVNSKEYERVEWVEAGYKWSRDMAQCVRYWLDFNAPGIRNNNINLANQANAIEDDSNATTGWSSLYGVPISVDAVETNNSNYAFKIEPVDGNPNIAGASRDGVLSDPNRTGETDAGTATSGSTISLTDVSKSWTDDEHAGKTLLINPGDPDNEDYAEIASNTSDTINLVSSLSVLVDNGTNYKITDLFVIDIEMKHDGGENRITVRRSLSGGGIFSVFTIDDSYINYQKFSFYAFAGESIQIRELGDANTGAAWIDNLVINEATPVNRDTIETAWLDLIDVMVADMSDPKWTDNLPIGSSAWGAGGRRVVKPSSEDFQAPDPGLE